MNELTPERLRQIFDHERFQKGWKPAVGHEVIYEDNKYIVIEYDWYHKLFNLSGNEKAVARIDEVTHIPSVPALQEMTELRLDWVRFDEKCKIAAFKYYQKPESNWGYVTEAISEQVPKLLTAAMVVMGDWATWGGFEKGWF